ncbi:hypothetical protein RvY_16077 [Ramazzottius varieornatus]|uniref:BTB domain-containing protein n=1 Tax=Ramazzottius varieornatus TaxID=947166 RepID=A0A1D1W1P5_RAMVA|nr:hypothetical protein RvY_16077 [Ramazzottius varieornatus]
MFQSNLTECQAGRCVIDDIQFSVMNVLIKHMYCDVSREDIQNGTAAIFIAADKYQLASLVNQCEQVLVANMTQENVVDFLTLADGINAPFLKNAAFGFMKAHSAAMKLSGAIKKLCENASHELFT